MEESFDKASFLIYKQDFNSISYLSDELLGLLFAVSDEGMYLAINEAATPSTDIRMMIKRPK